MLIDFTEIIFVDHRRQKNPVYSCIITEFSDTILIQGKWLIRHTVTKISCKNPVCSGDAQKEIT